MKKLKVLIPIVIVLLGVMVWKCESCNGTEKKNTYVPPPNLEELSCMLVRAYFLKTVDSTGQTVYINRDGDIYEQARLRYMKNPFLPSGTGVVMEGGFVGTVKHIELDVFGNAEVQEMVNEIEKGDSTQLPFLSKLSTYVQTGKLPDPTSTPWFYHELNSFIILPGSPKIPIQNALEREPGKTPEYCATAQLIFNGDKDVAVYKIKGLIPDKLTGKGFSMNDLMTVAETKEVQNAAPIESWGYPQNIRQWLSQTIAPKPSHGMVTGLPSSGFEAFETNLPMDQGGSGSFVIHQISGKVIGLVTGGMDNNTTLLTPAHYLADIYQDALDAEGNTTSK
ncbi:MAG: hypothetical protein H6573_08375 [Lewinellaceae bacterium]|nr:hypothetical protein [Phaeodactylibacter sp.]MCB0614286.1 hypothetical protein [Phaeodactylibacter sp.]MCB9347518.1 hypothetical protein [Lewinellaceae bacterium]